MTQNADIATPDNERQAQLKSKGLEEMRAEKGDAWVEANTALLDYQWEYLKASKFL